MISPRNAIQKMRPYSPPTGLRHGKLRLDFNENTVGCAPEILIGLSKALDQNWLATYPDYTEIQPKLASFFGVKEDQVNLTNGTDEAIQLVINTYVDPGDEVIVLDPTYAMYRFYAEIAGAEVREIGYRDVPGDSEFERVLSVSFEGITEVISDRTKVIFLPNPNNPTGSILTLSEIKKILLSRPNICVVVDEAYFDFWGISALPLIAQFTNLVVLRTFSKAHGLAGLRVGCILSTGENIANIQKGQSPYSVNCLATAAVSLAIDASKATQEFAKQAVLGRKLLETALAQNRFTYWRSEANFVLFDAGEVADLLLERCKEAGILIRDRRHDLPRALRVTAGTPNQVEQFTDILERIR